MQSVLFDQCDAQQYLELLSKKTTTHPYALLELSRAHLNIGNDTQSIEYIKQAERKFGRIPRYRRWSYEFMFYNIQFLCSIK
jgi:hypothetical protein